MPNDPPYGGQIKVNKNGSVTWAVSAREYPSYRDVDGSVEFAIRVVDKDRNIITSSDGKCIVHVHTDEIESEHRHLRFLIVSGYDMPTAPDNTTIVGKSYFVTMNRYPEFAEDETLPRYDLILQYDDYDLEAADLPRDLDLEDLHVCHQNWISVYKLWEAYMLDSQAAVDQITGSLDVTGKNIESLEKSFQMDLESLAIWAVVERHLREAGVTGDLQDILEMLVVSAKKNRLALTERGSTGPGTSTGPANAQADPSKPDGQVSQGTSPQTDEQNQFWVSRWHEVVEPDPNAKVAQHNVHTGTPQETTGENVPLTTEEKATAAIEGRLIRCDRLVRTPGSRAITVQGISDRGLFALMYHGQHEKHSNDSH